MTDEGLQKSENDFIILDAKMEAFDMYNQYLDGHTLLIPKPRRIFINMYDEKTALTDDDYKRIRSEELKRLKMENSKHENKKDAFLWQQHRMNNLNLSFTPLYFTPDIEDIHIGYECEIFERENWKPVIVDSSFGGVDDSLEIAKYYIKRNELRTLSLNKEQIEKEEGIIFHKEVSYWYSNEVNGYGFRKNNHWIILKYKGGLPLISIIPVDPVKEEGFWHEVRFIGYCKSINELRTILKLLNI